MKQNLKPNQLLVPGDNSGVKLVKIIHVYKSINKNMVGNLCLLSIQKVNIKKLKKIDRTELQKAVFVRVSGNNKIKLSLIRERELTTTLILLNKKNVPVSTRYITRFAKFELLETRIFKVWSLIRSF